MKILLAFLVLTATIIVANVAIMAGAFPPWAAIAVLGLSGTTLFAICFHEAAAALRSCQLCQKPLQDRRAAGEYAVKYGVRACGDCGPKLDQRFGAEESSDHPPVPPFMP